MIPHGQNEDDTINMKRNSAKPKTSLAGNNKNDIEEISINRQATLCVSSLTYKQDKRKDEFILQDIEFITPPESLTVNSLASRQWKIASSFSNRWRDLIHKWNHKLQRKCCLCASLTLGFLRMYFFQFCLFLFFTAINIVNKAQWL